ncbi:MAG: hypothetical protein QXU88_01925 [Candidatus Woesearchaeota archaeon]
MPLPTAPASGLFWLTLLVHIVDLFFGRLSGVSTPLTTILMLVSYSLITVFAWSVFQAKSWDEKRGYLLVSVIAFALPYVATFFVKFIPAAANAAQLILIFAPIWPIFLVFAKPEFVGNTARVFGTLYVIFWLTIFSLTYAAEIREASRRAAEAAGVQEVIKVEPGTQLKEVIKGAIGGLQRFTNVTKAQAEKQKEAIIGFRSYEELVDTKSAERIGVYFSPVPLPKEDWQAGETVTIESRLRASTLDYQLQLSLNCSAPGVAPERVRVIPSSKTLSGAEDVPVFCRIENGFDLSPDISQETKTIRFTADFEFVTMAYQKADFIDKERLIAQPPKSNKSYEKKATSAPVSIEYSLISSPIPIDFEGKNEFSLSIMLKSSLGWTGKIKKGKKLVLITPKGFNLNPSSDWYKGSCAVAETTFCDDLKNNVFVVDNPVEKTPYLALFELEPRTILQTPLTTHSFWTIAKYEYEIEHARTINVIRRMR